MKKMTVQELKKRLERGEVLLIDVREPGEHKSEHIEGAKLIPLGEISHEKLTDKSFPVVIHCNSGRRSEQACKKLLEQNADSDIYSLEGGIMSWKNEGFPVKNQGRSVLPLDRQTQLAVGFLVFTGVILGGFVHPAFYALSGFVGLGLMSAGLTGWCGMAKFLAKMPWNR